MEKIFNFGFVISDKMKTKFNTKEKTSSHARMNSPEVGSALVRIAHKLSSKSSEGQVVKLGEKYFRVKELG
jgi:hypothetical protein